MKPLRILALMHEELVPPEDAASRDVLNADWKTEFDITVTLRDMGHEVHTLGVADELKVIRAAVDDFKPHIVFNLLELFHGVPMFDQNIVAYLELLRVPYTGCSSRGLLLSRDKALSKQLLAYHRIRVPDFAVFRLGRRVRRPRRLQFPVIVKSLVHEGSIGISQASVVDSEEKLAERVKFIHDTSGSDAIAERYIDGRELYVGILGNERLQVFPVWEMSFAKMAPGNWRIATDRVKWSTQYQKKHGIKTDVAKVTPEQAQEIQRLAKRVYRGLNLNGYARIDLRLAEDGQVYVLEANPNPQLAFGEDLAESAERAGILYPDLLQRILNLGLRWRPDRAAPAD